RAWDTAGAEVHLVMRTHGDNERGLKQTQTTRAHVLRTRKDNTKPRTKIRYLANIALCLAVLMLFVPMLYPYVLKMTQIGKFTEFSANFDNPLRTNDIVYRSGDGNDKELRVTAKQGWRSLENAEETILANPVADFFVSKQDTITITGDHATMDNNNRMIRFYDNVLITHSNGHKFTMEEITIDIAKHTAVSHTEVHAISPLGVMRAGGIMITQKGSKITMLQRTSMKIIDSKTVIAR
ncbi:MAG: LPS export ABC transporter periplasmic protein LptC, partial [Pseudomonadota bacterium]